MPTMHELFDGSDPDLLPCARRRWTEQELATLREMYSGTKTEKIAALLGRPVGPVYQKAAALGLKKGTEYLASADACRLRRGGNIGAAYRFKPGQEAWNRGMKGLDMGGHATRFTKGQMPHNTRGVGDYRVTKDGTLQRKIGTAKGSNSKRWRGVHELVWVEANGPVPAGHICVFKLGMKTAELAAITADKVECISLAENMRRNTLHRYPKEVAHAIQLRGALNRKINRLTKEATK